MLLPAPRTFWIDHLRSFVTVLVVAHHSALAYCTFSVFDAQTYIRSTAPVVDTARWWGFDMLVSFNDMYFMPLMFFISGLFVLKSLAKKGRRQFITDRILRLGLPFAVAVTLIIPLAYIPSYILAGGNFQPALFIADYLRNQQWPVGPPWFIWLLLVFNLLAAMIPISYYLIAYRFASRLRHCPLLFLPLFFLCVCLAYVPLSLWLGPYAWTGFGPFDFQLNRLALYFLFFLSGTVLGSENPEYILFRRDTLTGKYVAGWCLAAVLVYLVKSALTSQPQWLDDILFSAGCLVAAFALTTAFRHFSKNNPAVWQHLSADAYDIYLLHYVFTTWLQYILLHSGLLAGIKFLIVFGFSLMLSWAATNLLRRIGLLRQLL